GRGHAISAATGGQRERGAERHRERTKFPKAGHPSLHLRILQARAEMRERPDASLLERATPRLPGGTGREVKRRSVEDSEKELRRQGDRQTTNDPLTPHWSGLRKADRFLAAQGIRRPGRQPLATMTWRGSRGTRRAAR